MVMSGNADEDEDDNDDGDNEIRMRAAMTTIRLSPMWVTATLTGARMASPESTVPERLGKARESQRD